jgi:thioredoxin 1
MSATATLPTVDATTFDATIAPGTGLVLVEFTAEWCGPCRMLAPVLEAVARDYAPHLRVVQIDADTNADTVIRFGVRGMPTILAFRDGQLVDRILGAVPARSLRERIDRLVPA